MRPLWQGCMRAQFAYLALAVAAIPFAAAATAAPPTPWDKPAAELAARIAEVLGPGPVRFSLRNLSTIPNDQVSVIHRLLEDDLRSSGISVTASDSGNAVRVTLSQNPAGGLWVAEIAEGNETRVVMAPADSAPAAAPTARQAVTLRREPIFRSSELKWTSALSGPQPSSEILAFAQLNGSLVALTPERVGVFAKSAQGWSEQEHADFASLHSGARDPRGIVVRGADGASFTAFAPGVACSGSYAPAGPAPGAWSVHCRSSDDPWPLMESAPDQWIRAFYNAGRDSFTGVLTSAGSALPPFYTAGLLPGRPSGAAVLIGALDGKVNLVESGQVRPVAGTRDWGSDFAIVASACGAPAHVLVSSSGDGAGDSLRAFELPSLEAVPVSDPLALNGAAMALWPAPDGKTALLIVRSAQPGRDWSYEGYRVSEACN